MAALAVLLARVRVAVMDAGSLVWSDAELTEGIRLAVGEYGLAGSAAVTLAGLDGAAESTLPQVHESLIVWGASGYAALSRAVDRAEVFQVGGEAGELKSWGEGRLREFKAMLGALFPGYLVVVSGGDGDPALSAAQAALALAKADEITQRVNERASEAARLADLRAAVDPPWGAWEEPRDISYPDDYDRR